ncbi:uncharacterized protein LOC135351288 [Halichondria panicea]|uniref:uncharacterized protein LOC135351288 n=1 Tax=Halichondria panicea TaxID=6063 RepID=UPI00312B46BB
MCAITLQPLKIAAVIRMSSQTSLVEKGKHCVAVASEVLKHNEMGQTVDASSKLVSMQKDAAVLANEAEKLAKRLEAVDDHYQEMDAKLHRQVGQLGMQEETLKTGKKNSESILAGQQSVLRNKESQLSSAESDLQRAEGKLRDAIKEEKSIQIGSAVGGAVLGLFTGGIGLLVGAGVGASIGAIVNACRDEEKDARSARGRRKSDVDSAKSAVQSSENQISSLASQIKDLALQIQRLEQKRQEIHQKRSEIKTAIPVLKNSTQFWLLFKQLSEDGENRSTLLNKIVKKAHERESYEMFQSNGSQSAANTFFEAWKSIEVAAADGFSNHIYSIDYNCVKCSSACKALPFLRGPDFICSICHLALQPTDC